MEIKWLGLGLTYRAGVRVRIRQKTGVRLT